jgi:hypothetical protein
MSVFEGVKPKDFVVYYDEHDLDRLLFTHTLVLTFSIYLSIFFHFLTILFYIHFREVLTRRQSGLNEVYTIRTNSY